MSRRGEGCPGHVDAVPAKTRLYEEEEGRLPRTRALLSASAQRIVKRVIPWHYPVSMENLNVGDLVQLKSGGPVMTIESRSDNNGEWNCVWFASTRSKDGEAMMPARGQFPGETLYTREDLSKKSK